MKINNNHYAIENKTTVFYKSPNLIRNIEDYKYKVLKPSTNKKLGKKVNKGKLKGARMYTLTLIERETCTDECEHYNDCYGNNMMYAHRFEVNDKLMFRIEQDLKEINDKQQIFLLRLHVLGDFNSPEYVQFWDRMLKKYKYLYIYGYTRNHITSKYKHIREIGKAIIKTRAKYNDRFAIRFSNAINEEFSANSEELTDKGITCLAQVKEEVTCADCTLCWASKKSVVFITH